MAAWVEAFADSAKNTAIAAAGSEARASSVADIRRYGPFNSLLVTNRDAVPIEVRLDGLTGSGRVIQVASGNTGGITPDEGVFFSSLVQVNLHASTAEVADTIVFRWAKAKRAD